MFLDALASLKPMLEIDWLSHIFETFWLLHHKTLKVHSKRITLDQLLALFYFLYIPQPWRNLYMAWLYFSGLHSLYISLDISIIFPKFYLFTSPL